MSQYNPGYSANYGSLRDAPNSPVNPDARPLPPGWVSQYDRNYNAWFYVNTNENPPRSSWVHPLGPPPPPSPRPGYAPPAGPPSSDNRGYSPSPYSGGYDQKPGYAQAPPPQRYDNYASPPPSGYGPSREGRGWFGGGQQPVQQQQPVIVESAPPQRKKHGIGMGTAVAAGGAGLLGGMLIEDLVERHDEHEREEGFDQGLSTGDPYMGGPDPGFDGGYDDDSGFF
ncbi:uncharacterized protein LAESUDRAFT_709886 [Laetiporus sulphureus 93-53]|uniref:WW domain-containing protein n=1 Tax=Laetiporus sulphureus 93-53 TaxID=1314785 RepID=A0A165I747_9APHY|nr:uncharacterized protein LAESUDRAFT_709886 [Laetiporus sulphureus 93-53]KZT12680.1 hypothetical protein LAESUDRAFT_709886 [Laetiporus sulphureus 93-53]